MMIKYNIGHQLSNESTKHKIKLATWELHLFTGLKSTVNKLKRPHTLESSTEKKGGMIHVIYLLGILTFLYFSKYFYINVYAIEFLYCIYWYLLRLLYTYLCIFTYRVKGTSGEPVFCTVNLNVTSGIHLVLILYSY